MLSILLVNCATIVQPKVICCQRGINILQWEDNWGTEDDMWCIGYGKCCVIEYGTMKAAVCTGSITGPWQVLCDVLLDHASSSVQYNWAMANAV